MAASDERRLTAVLFADIQGYSAMMQADEEKAMQALSGFRSIVNEVVSKYNGEKIQDLGDGCMLVFSSAIHALEAAESMQKYLRGRSINVRIGLHHGDVIFREGNVFGDSVNIASRIESAGVAGSILFSRDIQQLVRNQTRFSTSSLGTFRFKNIRDPLEVFALSNEGLYLPSASEIRGQLSDKSATSKGTVKGQRRWIIIGVVTSIILLLVAFRFMQGLTEDELLQSWVGEWIQTRETVQGSKEGSLVFQRKEDGAIGFATLFYGETSLTDTLSQFTVSEDGKTIEGNWRSELRDTYGSFKFVMNDSINAFDGFYTDHNSPIKFKWEGRR